MAAAEVLALTDARRRGEIRNRQGVPSSAPIACCECDGSEESLSLASASQSPDPSQKRPPCTRRNHSPFAHRSWPPFEKESRPSPSPLQACPLLSTTPERLDGQTSLSPEWTTGTASATALHCACTAPHWMWSVVAKEALC
jgi:hypothetical protein